MYATFPALRLSWSHVAFIALCAWSFAARAADSSPFPTLFTRVELPDGKTLLLGSVGDRNSAFGIARLNTDGSADHTFNGSGLVSVPIWSYDFANAAVVQADGKIVVGGHAVDPSSFEQCYFAGCGLYSVLTRLNDDGSIDRTFNGGKPVILQIGEADGSSPGRDLTSLVLQADGRIVVLGNGQFGARELARVNVDGTLDVAFSGPFFVQLVGFVPVIEYYAASTDHYFMTADSAEISALDRGVFPGWVRTYQSFHAFAPLAAHPETHQPVCRLASTPTSGLTAHLYVVAGSGRTGLGCNEPPGPGYGGRWIIESYDVFQIDVPNLLTGKCNPGLVPIYQLWMPDDDYSNSRYVTNVRVRDETIARGYVLIPHPVMCGAPYDY